MSKNICGCQWMLQAEVIFKFYNSHIFIVTRHGRIWLKSIACRPKLTTLSQPNSTQIHPSWNDKVIRLLSYKYQADSNFRLCLALSPPMRWQTMIIICKILFNCRQSRLFDLIGRSQAIIWPNTEKNKTCRKLDNSEKYIFHINKREQTEKTYCQFLPK